MRRLKVRELVRVDRPFSIFCEPAEDVPGAWIAHIVGHDLDNVTQGKGPTGAVFMAFDLLKLLTGECAPDKEHDWSIKGGLRVWVGPGDDDLEEVDSWTCSNCGEAAGVESFEEDG